MAKYYTFYDRSTSVERKRYLAFNFYTYIIIGLDNIYLYPFQVLNTIIIGILNVNIVGSIELSVLSNLYTAKTMKLEHKRNILVARLIRRTYACSKIQIVVVTLHIYNTEQCSILSILLSKATIEIFLGESVRIESGAISSYHT